MIYYVDIYIYIYTHIHHIHTWIPLWGTVNEHVPKTPSTSASNNHVDTLKPVKQGVSPSQLI